MTPKDTTKLTSFLHRNFWHLYPAITGRAFRLEELQKPEVKALRDKYVKTFLPELQRMTKSDKKGKSE